MSIERLGPVDPLSAYNKSQKSARSGSKAEGDSVLVSSEAREKADLLKVSEAVKAAPELRLERLEEIKKKLADPNYLTDAVLSKTADNILDAFGL